MSAVETEHFEHGFEALVIEGEEAKLEFVSSDCVQVLDQGASAIGCDPGEDGLEFGELGGICEDDLRIPRGGKFVPLEGAVKEFFGDAFDCRIELEVLILPSKGEDAGELEGFGFIVDFQKVNEME